MAMDKITIHRNRGLFHDSRKACRLLAQQYNEYVDYINWLENRNGALTRKTDELEKRIEVLENEN